MTRKQFALVVMTSTILAHVMHWRMLIGFNWLLIAYLYAWLADDYRATFKARSRRRRRTSA